MEWLIAQGGLLWLTTTSTSQLAPPHWKVGRGFCVTYRRRPGAVAGAFPYPGQAYNRDSREQPLSMQLDMIRARLAPFALPGSGAFLCPGQAYNHSLGGGLDPL
jgi:hypothetical protein